MQAVVLAETGGVEVMKLVNDHPIPKRGPKQVITPYTQLIAHNAARRLLEDRLALPHADLAGSATYACMYSELTVTRTVGYMICRASYTCDRMLVVCSGVGAHPQLFCQPC